MAWLAVIVAPFLGILLFLSAAPAEAASNLIPNGSFEGSGSGSLAGWKAAGATSSLASDGVDGTYAGRVAKAATSATSFSIAPYPLPVTSTTAGSVYTADAWVRSDTPGRSVCLRLREYTPGGANAKTKVTCLSVSGSWQMFSAVGFAAVASGDSLNITIYEQNSAAGDSFEVDGATLFATSDTTAPTVPTGVDATPVDPNEAYVSWAPASDNVGVTGYVVMRDGIEIGRTGATTSYEDKSVAAGTSYAYNVEAFDASGNTSAPSATASATTPAGTPICGTASGPPVTYSHVVLIVMENIKYSQVAGSAHAPYINWLTHSCASATNYDAIEHPSVPNYIDLTAGRNGGITTDCAPGTLQSTGLRCQSTDTSIFEQTRGDWTAYEEGMTSNCQKTTASPYSMRHNPPLYFVGLTGCATNDVPLAANPSFPSEYSYVAPDLCHDMHDSCTTSMARTYTFAGVSQGCTLSTISFNNAINCRIEQGDYWLSREIPKITQSSAYMNTPTAVFITWDEDAPPAQSSGNHVPFLALSRYITPGTTATGSYTHYNTLRTTEDLLGLPCLQNACSTASMRSAFGL